MYTPPLSSQADINLTGRYNSSHISRGLRCKIRKPTGKVLFVGDRADLITGAAILLAVYSVSGIIYRESCPSRHPLSTSTLIIVLQSSLPLYRTPFETSADLAIMPSATIYEHRGQRPVNKAARFALSFRVRPIKPAINCSRNRVKERKKKKKERKNNRSHNEREKRRK